jgi:hypothetical protein
MSVPYALKAADAETLGGKPLSAFQLAASQSNNGSRQKGEPLAEQPNEIRCAGGAACKASFLPVFSTNGGSANVNNSIISQSGTNIAIAGSEAVTSSANAPAILGQSTGTSGASIGVEGVTSSASSYAVAGRNQGSGIGVYGTSSSGHGVFGDTQGAIAYGVVGINEATGGIGVFGTAPKGIGFYTDGNVQQARTMGGWVKAMVLFSPYNGGGIALCFNSTLSGAAATTPPCGFNYHIFGVGDYMIDFGFQVDDRFLSATPTISFNTIGVCTDAIGLTCNNTLTLNQVEIYSTQPTCGCYSDTKPYLIVY